MAKSTAVAPKLSQTELREAYGKLKSKSKRANEIAKREGEAMMRNLVTVGSGGLMGYYVGDATKGGDMSKAQVSGIDIELIAGGGALAAGMMKWGGKFSDTLSAIGTGVLTGYMYRMGEDKGRKG